MEQIQQLYPNYFVNCYYGVQNDETKKRLTFDQFRDHYLVDYIRDISRFMETFKDKKEAARSVITLCYFVLGLQKSYEYTTLDMIHLSAIVELAAEVITPYFPKCFLGTLANHRNLPVEAFQRGLEIQAEII